MMIILRRSATHGLVRLGVFKIVRNFYILTCHQHMIHLRRQ